MAATFTSNDPTTPAIEASSSNGARGMFAESKTNNAIEGKSASKSGVHGISTSDKGVHGESPDGTGVYGESDKQHGVVGVTRGQGVAGGSFRCEYIGGLAGLFQGPVAIRPQNGDVSALKITFDGQGKNAGIELENTNSPQNQYHSFLICIQNGLLHFINQYGQNCMTLSETGDLKVYGRIQAQNVPIIGFSEDVTNNADLTQVNRNASAVSPELS